MAIRIGALPAAGPAIQQSFRRIRTRPQPGTAEAGIYLIGDVTALGLAAIVFAPGVVAGLFTAALSLTLLLGSGRYRRRRIGQLRSVWTLLVAAAVVPAAFLAMVGVAGQDTLREGALGSVLLLVATLLSASCTRARKATGRDMARALIVGGGQLGKDIASILGTHPEYGLVPVGFVDDIEDGADLPLPHFGSVRFLEQAVREHVVSQVVVAYGPGQDQKLVPVLRACQEAGVTVRVVPRFFELGCEIAFDDVWGLPLATLRPIPVGSSAWAGKRALDIVVSATALLVSSPLMVLLALAVRLSSPGPVLFRQDRIGRGGKTIQVLKFRSMRVNSDSDTTWDVTGDSRITRVGRVMRRTSLDELPQFFNVLKGDMSLVGPRPERPHFVHQFSAEIVSYDSRHRVPGGLTGWAQVHGLRGDTSIVERARFDNRYIESWSLARDLTILVRTIPSVLRDVRRGN